MWWFLLACSTPDSPAPSPDTQQEASGTEDDVDSADDTDASNDTGLCADGTEYTWDNFGRQFFVDFCESCHNHTEPGSGVPPGMVFDNEEIVWSLRYPILSRVVEPGPGSAPPMPPEMDRPTTDMFIREYAIEKQIGILHLEEWLNCGGPSAD